MQLKEVNRMMGDVIQRMNQNRAFEGQYTELQSIADKIVANTSNFEGLLTTVNDKKTQKLFILLL